jgi:hypothetical protein
MRRKAKGIADLLPRVPDFPTRFMSLGIDKVGVGDARSDTYTLQRAQGESEIYLGWINQSCSFRP